MFGLVIIVAIGYVVFAFRQQFTIIGKVLWGMSLYSKTVGAVFIIGIMPLIFQELLGGRIFFAVCYTLLLTGFQLYRTYRAGRAKGCYLPQAVFWLIPCILLVMITPICDLVLGRRYFYQSSALVGATTISYVCLYLIEIYIRHPHLCLAEEKQVEQ